MYVPSIVMLSQFSNIKVICFKLIAIPLALSWKAQPQRYQTFFWHVYLQSLPVNPASALRKILPEFLLPDYLEAEEDSPRNFL